MADFFELDFLDVESNKSGDAIALRYRLGNYSYIHVVDGGFQDTGPSMVKHINGYYGNPPFIDHVVVTHPDGDHAGGVRTVLQSFNVGTLWMLRPWLYAQYLLPQFPTYSSAVTLASRLRNIYSNISDLEAIANARRIQIREPFQGQIIGAFRVLAPSQARYLDLIVNSEKTPETASEFRQGLLGALGQSFFDAIKEAGNLVKGLWGHEVFSAEETSAENEMSVVQWAHLCNTRILLTADAGRTALNDAANFATATGIFLPGVDRFQVPHHGSRRNVSTEILDRWLGPRKLLRDGNSTFTAICSSAKLDEAHPRKSVKRAIIHRGGQFYATEGKSIRSSGGDAPARPGWVNLTPDEYPEEQEE